jgi:hypothetical protein
MMTPWHLQKWYDFKDEQKALSLAERCVSSSRRQRPAQRGASCCVCLCV